MKFARYILLGTCCLLAASSCHTMMYMQQKNLYDEKPLGSNNEINGFKALSIFNDEYDKSVWVSPEKKCVELNLETKEVYSNKSSLHVKWDKIKGGCKWIGIGFGWNNWMAKNMIDITSTCAVEMQVKSVKGSFSNLPVAFAFEDYAGIQTYSGFMKKYAEGTFNDSTWTKVVIPLSTFDFQKNDFNIENVKQFMIQLEGDGNVYLDQIKFVEL